MRLSAMTALADKMRALAETGHPRAAELRDKADQFDYTHRGYYSQPQTVEVKSYLGAYARAKRTWHECIGEQFP